MEILLSILVISFWVIFPLAMYFATKHGKKIKQHIAEF